MLAQLDPHGENNVDSEPFLQNFISRSLVPEGTSKDAALARQDKPATGQSLPQGSTETPVSSFGERPTGELTAAATKMVVGLVAILIVLILGAQVLRRYVFPLATYGQNGQLLQVVAKAPITTKSMVALIKVPGKSIVIGISGTTLVALGEIPDEAMEEPEPESETVSESFAASLHRYAKGQESQNGQEGALLTVQEVIQQKVNGLKQL
jgi:flagellar biogenesis protein FliO